VEVTADPLSAPFPFDLPEAEPVARMPSGYRAGAATAGIKPSGRPDLGIVVVDGPPAPVGAVFTTNRFPSAPVIVSRDHLRATSPDGGEDHGFARALLSTSGCANAATGEGGLADQRRLAECLADALGVAARETLAVSTGLIGTRLPVDRAAAAIERLVTSGLTAGDEALAAVAEALRTTDTRAKAATMRVELPDAAGRPVGVTVTGIAKGVGMIHPRMATMLSYVLTDASAAPATLQAMLRGVAARTWDQLSVDGDTSTSDTVFLVASGRSGAAPVVPGSTAARTLARGVESVARSLARQQAADGEGATALITCQVTGGEDGPTARAVARAVVASSLVKAAIHGRDPNWGRIVAACGNAQLADAPVLVAAGMDPATARERGGQRVDLDPARMRVAICGTPVFAGEPLPFDAVTVSSAMGTGEVLIRVDLGAGDAAGEAFGCDLTEAYVVENSAYST
jgi:glutamate N-acetyltransferase/amino-acid N-acetyltransferase